MTSLSPSTPALAPEFPKVASVGFIVKREHGQAHGQMIALARRLLNERGVAVLVEERSAAEDLDALPGLIVTRQEDIAARCDLMVVIGGDGTLIHAVHLLGERAVPVIAVNAGTLGFLSEITIDEAWGAIDAVLQDRFAVTARRTLRAELWRNGAMAHAGFVLNDAVVNKAALARIVHLRLSVGGRFVNSYRGDGLIVATPTGTTAYNMAAGGPIVYPTLNLVTITPICSFALTDRPLILPDDADIEIECRRMNGKVYLTLDGQSGVLMQAGDQIRIRRAHAVYTVRSASKDYFAVLRTKLRWGSADDGEGG